MSGVGAYSEIFVVWGCADIGKLEVRGLSPQKLCTILVRRQKFVSSCEDCTCKKSAIIEKQILRPMSNNFDNLTYWFQFVDCDFFIIPLKYSMTQKGFKNLLG